MKFYNVSPINRFKYDGEYWHKLNNQNNKLNDSKRDKILIDLGWKIIRIKEGDGYEI